jgi:HTH-type transcriptional regulator / antitoxin HigA
MEEATMSTTKTKASNKSTERYLELIRKFPLRPIRTKTELAAATRILDSLFGRDDADSGETDYVDVLSDLVDAYERENDPNYDSEATGLEVLHALMEDRGMKQSTLAAKLNISAPAMSLILSDKRPITAQHARNLGKIFSVDPGVFI